MRINGVTVEATEHASAQEALQHLEVSGGDFGIVVGGRYLTAKKAEVEKIAAAGIEFAYLYLDDHHGTPPHIQAQLSAFATALKTATPHAFVTPSLIAINVILYILIVLSRAEIFTTDFDCVIFWSGHYGPLTMHGQWWRLLTSPFVHSGILHILFNMLALWMVGAFVERLFGNCVYLGIYLTSAIASSLVSLMWHAGNIGVGASGAIFGVYGALIGYLIIQKSSLPRSVWSELRGSVIPLVLLMLYGGLADKMTDNAGHVGGLIAGFGMGMALARPLDSRVRSKCKGEEVATSGPSRRQRRRHK